MTSIRNDRPYTNPWLKNPTYPTVTEYHRIVEMTWEQRTGRRTMDQHPDGFVLEADDMAALRKIQEQLHGGTDRERDYGHRIWLILTRAIPIRSDQLIDS